MNEHLSIQTTLIICAQATKCKLYVHFNTLFAAENPKLFPCFMDLLLCNKIMLCDHK